MRGSHHRRETEWATFRRRGSQDQLLLLSMAMAIYLLGDAVTMNVMSPDCILSQNDMTTPNFLMTVANDRNV